LICVVVDFLCVYQIIIIKSKIAKFKGSAIALQVCKK
jgi:hypothetical protein